MKGTGPTVAERLDHLHDLTDTDEIMLVTMGRSREVQARTLELIADHYGLPQDVAV